MDEAGSLPLEAVRGVEFGEAEPIDVEFDEAEKEFTPNNVRSWFADKPP
jgi:hypothetical protein